MSDLARPRHIGHVEQAIDAFLQFDEGTIVRQVPHFADDDASLGVLVQDFVPWIGRRLLHTQRQLLAGRVDAEDLYVDDIADLHQLAGVVDAPRPGHFADVNQAFDTGFQFDECPVTHHIDDFSLDHRTDGVLLFDVVPGVAFFLLQSQRDFLFFSINLQDFDFDFLIDGDHFGRMADTLPAHIGDVKQPVDASQVDESAEVGDVLDHTFADLTDFEFVQQVFAILFTLLFDQGTP